MSIVNLVLVICLVGLTMTPISIAQNSPQDFVDAHNVHRTAVGNGPVEWNETLASFAKKYALKQKATCEMEHSMGPYGECLAMGQGMTGTEAVNFWATEKEFYDPNSNKCVRDECGHFLQVVWKDTKYIGCARAQCDNVNMVFVTCNYDPSYNPDGRPY